MGPVARPRRIVKFGVFELDLRTSELSKRGLKLSLQGQPIQILIMLTERPGELVTRDELRNSLWPTDTYVDFEQGLNAAVKRLRQALNDSAENPRFVETLPRRGYRFIAPVEVVNPAEPIANRDVTFDLPSFNVQDPVELPEVTAAPEHRALGLRFPKAVVVVLLFVLAGGSVWMLRPWHRLSPVIQSMAVLPLENLSGDASQDYFSDGMTDELITELGQISELRVISRTSIMTYKNARKPLPQIARELNVDAIVEGTVLRSGSRVRITAQLILASSDKHLWAKSYEGDLRDTLALQNEVARAIAMQVQTKLKPEKEAGLKRITPENPEAHEAYLKGRYFWNKRTGEGLTKAVEYFSLAVEKDPNYAQAYAGLADSYALLGDWEYGVMAPAEAYPKAKAAATKALQLDNGLGAAHISLAFSLDGFDWNFSYADKEFKKGVELDPSYATGHQWYAGHLTLLGRDTEAVSEMKKAADLDPLSLIIGADLAEDLLIAHQYEEAIQQSRKTIGLDPSFAMAHYMLGQVFLQQHLYPDAIAELRQAVALSGSSTACTSALAYAYGVSGRRDEALKILNDIKNGSHSYFSNAPEIASIYVGLNEKDQAMAWLEKAYAERFNPGVLRRPCFDALRPEPRFQAFLHRIGLKN